MTSMLESSGFEDIHITSWWKLFDRVLANKKGTSQPIGAKSLADVLQCPACSQTGWTKTAQHSLQCLNCGNQLTVTGQGIVLN